LNTPLTLDILELSIRKIFSQPVTGPHVHPVFFQDMVHTEGKVYFHKSETTKIIVFCEGFQFVFLPDGKFISAQFYPLSHFFNSKDKLFYLLQYDIFQLDS